MKPLAQNTLIQNRYLIVQLIGKGGMGEVYLAVDQRLGSAIALKRTFFAGDEMLGNAFEREARVLARLRHPVLPKVSDHFGEGEEQFLVMEHISGEDLSKRIEVQQKPFPLSWVMFWADQLLDALSYLHSHEPPIIHRDIKPQNLKLTDENHVVLLDFGLSKSSTGLTNLSGGASTGSTGSVVGYTPHYAPMEQIRGIGTSARSDLYSLSATLYQLMTNVVPADALSRADSMLNGLQDPIESPSTLNAEVPPAVSQVILKGMEVSQEKRFGSAREMQKAMRKAFSEMQTAMSAQTIAFNAAAVETNGVETPSFEATEVMDPTAIRAISNPGGVGGAPATPFSESISQPGGTPAVDLNATIAFDQNTGGDSVRQADVKTEVFIANSFPVNQSEPEPYVSTPTPSASNPVEDFSATTDYSGYSSQSSEFAPNTNESYSPEATVPLIAYQENGGNAPVQETSNSGGEFTEQPGSFNTVINQGEQEYVQEPSYSQAEAVAPAAAVHVPAKKKGSAGKIVLILGGLAVFFIVLLAAGGGGWYYYTNYYAGATVEPSPSPSPEPSITPSPSPEPTAENVFGADNTNTNANSSNSLTVEPTPTPREVQTSDDGPDTRPTPVGTKTPRPQQSKTPKPVPTKKPGGTGPDILQ
jgi:serine/threonine protein kinase